MSGQLAQPRSTTASQIIGNNVKVPPSVRIFMVKGVALQFSIDGRAMPTKVRRNLNFVLSGLQQLVDRTAFVQSQLIVGSLHNDLLPEPQKGTIQSKSHLVIDTTRLHPKGAQVGVTGRGGMGMGRRQGRSSVLKVFENVEFLLIEPGKERIEEVGGKAFGVPV